MPTGKPRGGRPGQWLPSDPLRPNPKRRPRRPKPPKLSYKDQRDFDLLPGRIEEIEAAIARDEAALSDPDLYAKNPKRFAELTRAIDKARAEKDAAEERWLALAEMAEGLGS